MDCFITIRKSNFPTKLELLDSVGILPTTIVRNLNVERNLLEHEYIVPTVDRVQEALDIAQLIYMASDAFLSHTVVEAVVGQITDPRHVVLRVEPRLGELHFFELDPGENVRVSEHNIEFIAHNLRNSMTGEVFPDFT